ncbi:MAG: hypothetical protein HC881_07785, partial [Leptolyngbyaceae cyanobacterium SL_7_1]|nr:hypothetical protein [Leptolyngbyaceae cyanobacterium SL_7_1]
RCRPDRPAVRVQVLVSPKRRRSPVHPTPVKPPATQEMPAIAIEEDWEDDRDPIRVLITPKPPLLQRGVVQGLLFTGFWTAMAALVASGGWLAIQLILNPGAVRGLGWVFPGWQGSSLSAGHTPRSLAVIRQGAAEVGLSLGEPLGLEVDAAAVTAHSDLLIPVFAADANCASAIAPASPSVPPCSHLVELRVYRPYPSARQPLLQLLDRLAVAGPQESFVLAPLQSDASDSLGSSRSLPLLSVDRMVGTSPSANLVWFQLGGQWKQGNTQLAFGQVGYYDPTQSRLHLLTQWTSPAGKAAAWQDAIAGGTTELVVDQTIGLEPGFKVYQLMGTSDRQLQPISLSQAALDNATYQRAIALAQSGLWSPALVLMQWVKARAAWSASAQAQLAVVELHAQATRQQAERSWENPSQKSWHC